MQRFRRLAVASAVAVGMPIMLGGVVRATGSGDACPDWPRCFGRWIPPPNHHAILEYSHRLAAAVSGVFLLALALALLANRKTRAMRSLTVPAGVAFVLLLFQSYLGKLVVERSLSPALVTLHLGTALLLQATVTVAAVNSFYGTRVPEPSTDPKFAPGSADEPLDTPSASEARDEIPSGSPRTREIAPPAGLALLASASVFAVVLVGAYMRAEGAQLVFSDWPLMAGRLVPPLSTEPQRIHFAHRLLALLGAVPIVWFAVRATSYRPRVRAMVAFAHLTAGAYVLQALAGAATVLTDLSQWSRATHVALASVAFAASIAAAAVCVNQAAKGSSSTSRRAQVRAA